MSFKPDYLNFFEIDQSGMPLDKNAAPFKCKNCGESQLVPVGTLPGTEMMCKSCRMFGPYEPPKIMQNQNFDPLAQSQTSQFGGNVV